MLSSLDIAWDPVLMRVILRVSCRLLGLLKSIRLLTHWSVSPTCVSSYHSTQLHLSRTDFSRTLAPSPLRPPLDPHTRPVGQRWLPIDSGGPNASRRSTCSAYLSSDRYPDVFPRFPFWSFSG